jgi:transcriptional regulator with XRE-family HTH domain
MARENTQLMAILEREFQRIRELEQNPALGRTYREMAEELGILPSTLSHYRAGNRFPSRANGQEMAGLLRSDKRGGSDEARQALVEELLAARPVDDQVHAQDWLRSIGREGHLLLVEFRDFPSARSSNPNRQVAREMAKEAGRAVAKGLAYALLNPFASESQSNTDLIPLKNYLNSLDEAIRETYKRILGEAYRQVISDFPNSDQLEQELKKVKKLLRCYRWAGPSPSSGYLDSCPGIGYKLFYHVEGLETPDLWHWLSTPNGEMLIRKTQNEAELNAVESRFYPILEYFDKYTRFPTTDQMKGWANGDLRESLWGEVEAITSKDDLALIKKAKAGEL